jgi:hypothetical protein
VDARELVALVVAGEERAAGDGPAVTRSLQWLPIESALARCISAELIQPNVKYRKPAAILRTNAISPEPQMQIHFEGHDRVTRVEG